MPKEGPFARLARREIWVKAVADRDRAALGREAGAIIERAYAADPAGAGSLGDIEHVVLLMHENRSFDHYFGTMSGVRGFGDASSAFRQRGYAPGTGPSADGYLNPFRLSTAHGATLNGEVINDPSHEWDTQHHSWNNGAMDQWVAAHLQADGPGNGPVTMGYYDREDIPVHRALAEAFTICDHYFCSVMGPTDPNRLYWMTGTIDPDGQAGGPVLETALDPKAGVYSWRTYPEQLQEAGISWKIYQDQGVVEFLNRAFLSGMMRQFKAFSDHPDSPLAARALHPSYPHDLRSDVENGTLPAVSWVIPSLVDCEHPAMPPAEGAAGILRVLDILTSNPAIWEKTALILSYDENGGFFDHVPPPTAPPGTPGEWITAPLGQVAQADGIAGPVGLGFRVPCLIISPYSRGGLVASDVFDHTSQLRFLERRFGVPVPNLSAWRRAATGDLTSAFDFARPASAGPLPPPDPELVRLTALVEDSVTLLRGTLDHGKPFPMPPNSMPVQESLPLRRAPSGLPRLPLVLAGVGPIFRRILRFVMLCDALVVGIGVFSSLRYAFGPVGARVKKRIIGTIAVTAAAGLACVTGLRIAATPAVNRTHGLLAVQRSCLAAGACASKPVTATGRATTGRGMASGRGIAARQGTAARRVAAPSRAAAAGRGGAVLVSASAARAERAPVPAADPSPAAPSRAVTHRRPSSRPATPRGGYGPIRTAAGFVTAAAQRNGERIAYGRWTGLPGQEWHAYADGTIRDAAGYCLDNAGGAGGAGEAGGAGGAGEAGGAGGAGEAGGAATVVPQIWRCNGGDAQRWQVIPNAGMISAKGVGKTLPWTVADADYDSSPGTGTIGLDGMNITRNGKVFIPYGISSSVFQYPDRPYLDGPGNPQGLTPLREAEDQVAASVTAWHSNTFRFQVEQNLCLTDTGCVAGVVAAVRYAESLGQVVVLNPNTEASEAGTQQYATPFPDASTTAFWRAFAPYFAGDRDVILDVFNEPGHGQPCCDWGTWKSSFQSEIDAIRAMGYTNQLWVEPLGGDGFDNGYFQAHWSAEHLTDPDNDLVYDYHHVAAPGPAGSTAPDVASWSRQFGDMVADQVAPVTDGEWTNRSQGTAASPAAECWPTAPTAVPAYLAYLDAEGIGLSAWAMGDNPDGSSILTAVSGGFASANSYPARGYTCDTGESGVYGAGAGLQAWWAKRTARPGG
jgi:phospholipase C